MIRIVKGTFGWYDGRRVIPKTRADGPFRADDGLEARLVAEGVAEYADEGAADAEPTKPEAPAAPVADEAPEAESDLESMTKAELEDVARELGVTVGRKTKAQLIEAIEEADEPPALDAAEVE